MVEIILIGSLIQFIYDYYPSKTSQFIVLNVYILHFIKRTDKYSVNLPFNNQFN